MLEDGRWRHPGEQALLRVIPWLDEKMEFMSVETMEAETTALARVTAEYEGQAQIYWVARGSAQAKPAGLPWLDIEAAYLIVVSRYSDGDMVALDYRTGAENPRVVAFGEIYGIDLHQGGTTLFGWRMVAPTFSDFVAALNL
ncbi:SMI1/KNR4 family protein [Actinomadura sp. HBU206391]|uniref:SMI1/KNR4 family protein n=1 Tax=Actinomadura sp. HBU206391 TaxID=2731692 RepID=UPI00164EE6A7|nr:SMI1/KNR4 family protein [Actinomadura sp. HBU206391]MBC6463244.1 hypothetical protein [Actinomadura sp. HBU206391]